MRSRSGRRRNIHKNARLTPLRREEMALSVIDGRLSKAEAARTYGVSAKIVARWMEALPHQAHHLNLINHLR